MFLVGDLFVDGSNAARKLAQDDDRKHHLRRCVEHLDYALVTAHQRAKRVTADDVEPQSELL